MREPRGFQHVSQSPGSQAACTCLSRALLAPSRICASPHSSWVPLPWVSKQVYRTLSSLLPKEPSAKPLVTTRGRDKTSATICPTPAGGSVGAPPRLAGDSGFSGAAPRTHPGWCSRLTGPRPASTPAFCLPRAVEGGVSGALRDRASHAPCSEHRALPLTSSGFLTCSYDSVNQQCPCPSPENPPPHPRKCTRGCAHTEQVHAWVCTHT